MANPGGHFSSAAGGAVFILRRIAFSSARLPHDRTYPHAPRFAPLPENRLVPVWRRAPDDWSGFPRTRLDGHGPGTALDGLARTGWKLVYGEQPAELLLKKGKQFHTVAIDYHGGLKYPRLERIQGTPDRLQAILQPLK